MGRQLEGAADWSRPEREKTRTQQSGDSQQATSKRCPHILYKLSSYKSD
jgi:hypothetical protein